MAQRIVFSFILFLLSGSLIFGQSIHESKVPPSVRTAFQRTNPSTTASWNRAAHGSFEASFKSSKGNDFIYVYDVSGRLLKKKKAVTKTQLPASIQAKIRGDFKNPSVKSAYQVLAKSSKYYEVSLVTSTSREKVNYSGAGAVLAQNTQPLPGATNSTMASNNTSSQPMASANSAPLMRGESASTSDVNYDNIDLDDLDDFDLDSELDDLLDDEEYDDSDFGDLDDIDDWLDDDEDLDEFGDDDL